MNELTVKQQRVLAFIQRHIQSHGRPPTRAEIAQGLGFSSLNAAETHLRALARKGAIELTPGGARGIRLTAEASPEGSLAAAAAGLPLIGRVAAGSPVLAEQNVEARFEVDRTLFHPTADYLLRVSGMSMRDAGILDGDLLVVHRTPEARNGQIVVARLGDEVTVKRFERSDRRVRLLPANPDFSPIEIQLDHDPLDIEGIAVGVIRNGRL